MPESPEVEIMRRNLLRWTRGRRITRVDLLRPATMSGDHAASSTLVEGARLTHALRRGKVLWMAFSSSSGWLVRFGMTGKWVRCRPGQPMPRFARIRLLLNDGHAILFLDRRNLGRIQAFHPAPQGPTLLKHAAPGRDPLLEGISGRNLETLFARRRSPVKTLLLDQSLIAGIGNIYAAETLFTARIHPRTPGNTLDLQACTRLAQAIHQRLVWAIDTFDGDDIALQGEPGADQAPFQVYRRTGRPCPRCRAPIRRDTIAGRATFFCPTCQSLPGAKA